VVIRDRIGDPPLHVRRRVALCLLQKLSQQLAPFLPLADGSDQFVSPRFQQGDFFGQQLQLRSQHGYLLLIHIKITTTPTAASAEMENAAMLKITSFPSAAISAAVLNNDEFTA
jgi:hypothetical protein